MTGLDETVAGWKIVMAGGRPVATPLLRDSVLQSGATSWWQDDRECKIEMELGFTLNRDLPAGPLTREDLVRSIASVHAVFEIGGPRAGLPPQAPPAALPANASGNAATVVGGGKAVLKYPEFAKLYRDDSLAAEGRHPYTDPLTSILVYAAIQPDSLSGLRCGHVIITGSFTGTTSVEKPGHFKGVFEGLAPVEVTFARNGNV